MLLEADDNLDLMALDEAYKGKSKATQQLEQMIAKSRAKYRGTFKVGGGYYNDPDFVAIGDKLAKIFSFRLVDFNLINDPMPNAFCIPCGFSFTANDGHGLIKIDTKSGETLKFKSKDLCSVIRVTSGLWTNPTFTDAEVTAMVLHEMGHNFANETNQGLRYYATAMWALNLADVIIQAGSVFGLPSAIVTLVQNDSDLRAKWNKAVKGIDFLSKLTTIGSNILGFIRMITYEVVELFGRLTLGIPAGVINMASVLLQSATNPISMLISVLVAPIKKGQERVSDSFAAEHGYGPELISALSKIDLDPEASGTAVGRVAKKLPVFDSICTLFALPTMMVSQLIADHPLTPHRAMSIVKELERELDKSDVSPKMKKEIEKQIKEVKDVIQKASASNGAAEGTAFRKALYRLNTNFDKDPGIIQKSFTKKNLIEMVEALDEDTIYMDNILSDTLEDNIDDDDIDEFDYMDLFDELED